MLIPPHPGREQGNAELQTSMLADAEDYRRHMARVDRKFDKSMRLMYPKARPTGRSYGARLSARATRRLADNKQNRVSKRELLHLFGVRTIAQSRHFWAFLECWGGV